MKIKSNKIKCNNCGDIIESTHKHDFVVCKCWTDEGARGCAVDGGKHYLRRVGSNWEDMSEYEEEKV